MIEKFKNYVRQLAKIPGIKELYNFIMNSDFTRAPASTRYHNSKEGGLLEHSLNVTDILCDLTKKLGLQWQRPESPIIIGLFHDLCKVNFYKVSYRNTKNEEGNWIKVPYYEVDDKDPLGHGSKSVIMLMKYIQLTDEEIYCINYHMHAYGLNQSEQQNLSNAVRKYPNILMACLADELSGVNEDINRNIIGGKDNG